MSESRAHVPARASARLKTRLRLWLGRDPDSFAARLDTLVMDQGLWRLRSDNFHQIAPGLWRSNQPTPDRLERYAALGVQRVINLRGPLPYAVLRRERRACHALGLDLIEVPLSAEDAPARDVMRELVAALRDPVPTLIHCRAGADRTGLASALALVMRGAPLHEARGQLSWRYGHVRFGRAGIMGAVLDQFAASGRDLQDWVARDYDPQALPRRRVLF